MSTRLDKLRRDGKISKQEYEQRKRQSAIDKVLYGRKRGFQNALATKIDSISEPEWFVSSVVHALGCIFDPGNFTGKVVDPFTFVESDPQTFKTEFTVAPDANGNVRLGFYPAPKHLVSVLAGVATYQSQLYYPSGPNGTELAMYKYASTDPLTASFRVVGMSVDCAFEGDSIYDGGVAAIASFPRFTGTPTPPDTYDGIAGYTGSVTRPVREGTYQALLPQSWHQMMAPRDFTDNASSAVFEFIRYGAEGINVTGTYPNNLPRLRFIVEITLELFSVEPFLTGGVTNRVAGMATIEDYHPKTLTAVAQIGRHIGKHRHHSGHHGWNLGNALEGIASWGIKGLSKEFHHYLPAIEKEMRKLPGAILPLAAAAL